jgi:hypothetical protein
LDERYLPAQSAINDVLRSHGRSFEPCTFDEAFAETFLRACMEGSDPTAERDEASVRRGKEESVPSWRSLWSGKRKHA